MAEDERPFLARWSRRKRQARAVETPVEDVPARAGPEPEIDPASLPPIESLGPGSDIVAFLQKGVPEALRRAALRRIWTADPKIKGFREVADYDWDFNAPGYGALAPTDNVREAAERLLARVRRPADEPPDPPPPAEALTAAPIEAPIEANEDRSAGPLVAEVAEEPKAPEPVRRRHGGAMPR